MYKKILISALLIAVLAGGTRSAMAGPTHYGGPLKTTFTDNAHPQGVDQSVWDVSVTQVGGPTSLLWHVLVSWDHNIAPEPQFVNQVDVRLLDTGNPPDNNPPGEPIDPVTAPPVTAPPGNGQTTDGVTPYLWNAELQQQASQVSYTAPRKKKKLRQTKGDPRPETWIRNGRSFSSDITLDLNSNPILGVYFGLTGSGGGTGIYPGATGVTPEGASLLLFLPGLIPVVVGLRRRRLNKSVGE